MTIDDAQLWYICDVWIVGKFSKSFAILHSNYFFMFSAKLVSCWRPFYFQPPPLLLVSCLASMLFPLCLCICCRLVYRRPCCSQRHCSCRCLHPCCGWYCCWCPSCCWRTCCWWRSCCSLHFTFLQYLSLAFMLSLAFTSSKTKHLFLRRSFFGWTFLSFGDQISGRRIRDKITCILFFPTMGLCPRYLSNIGLTNKLSFARFCFFMILRCSPTTYNEKKSIHQFTNWGGGGGGGGGTLYGATEDDTQYVQNCTYIRWAASAA